MPMSASRKQRTRNRIVDAAGELFRERGYRGATIDDIMAAADLTRGTFYAHFGSKEALFAEVVATRHDLLRRLRERDNATARELRLQGQAILRDYVDPDNQSKVGPNCTLSTLSADVARTDAEIREAFAGLLESFAAEIGRGYGRTRVPTFAVLSMLVGGVLLAHGCRGTDPEQSILEQCQRAIGDLLGSG